MKAINHISLLIVFAVICCGSVSSFANTICVGEECEIKTIKEGIAKAEACDTLIIYKGYYAEGNILVDKPLTILGIDYPVIDGKNETEILTVYSDYVTVKGLKVVNVGISHLEDRAGIRIRRSRHWLVEGNILENTLFGIYLEKAHEGIVRGNTIIGEAEVEMSSGNAIHAWYCKDIEVLNNHVEKHRDGIYFEFVDRAIVRGNVSVDNIRYGLHFMFSNDDVYHENTFESNGAGVAVMFSRRIEMFDNLFLHNWGKSSYGLLLKEINDANIYHNVFNANTIGILVEGSNRIKYKNNDFIRNGWALHVSGGCLDNKIEGNNFISNTFNLAMKSKPTSDLIIGNFWNDYNGFDLDKDGIGDIPYRPIKLYNYIVGRVPESIVLLRSLFVDLINFSEKVAPVYTPVEAMDTKPMMQKIQWIMGQDKKING